MMGRIMDTTDEWIVPRTGIRERRFVEPGIGSAELGAKAAEAALADAGLEAADIDFVDLRDDDARPLLSRATAGSSRGASA